jgi:RNA polymerase sigma-70 factor (ECF subfamily)
VLRYVYVDGLRVEQVAQIHAVHRVTASRWLSEAKMTLGKRARAALARDLGVNAAEVRSILRLLGSAMEVSMRGLLTET